MESTWQAAPTAVTSMLQHSFPAHPSFADEPVLTTRVDAHAGRRINSSLVLQQLLYYNCFWSAAWILTVAVRVYFKVRITACSNQVRTSVAPAT